MTFYAHTSPQDSNKWHPLKCHLFKVAKQAKEHGNKFNAGELAYYAGLWHDLGKYNPEFQEYLRQCDLATKEGEKPPSKKVPHAKYGAKLAAEKFPFITSIIYGHHTGLPQAAYMMARLEEVRLETYQQILGNASADFLNSDIDSEADRQFTSLLSNAYSNELLIRVLFPA